MDEIKLQNNEIVLSEEEVKQLDEVGKEFEDETSNGKGEEE